MPTSQQILLIKDELRKAFEKIGFTIPPIKISPGNRDPIAYELFVAQFLEDCAKTRKERALAKAIEHNIAFDHKVHPSNDLGIYNLYNSELVSVDVEVKRGAQRIDPKAFAAALIAQKVDVSIVQSAQITATKYNANSHSFRATLVASGGSSE